MVVAMWLYCFMARAGDKSPSVQRTEAKEVEN